MNFIVTDTDPSASKTKPTLKKGRSNSFNRQLAAEVQALKQRISEMEEKQKIQENTYRVPQSLAELKPRRQPPAGKTVMEMIRDQWPGEETTEELLAKLKEMG